jgi:SNF2 family DNA or RNA helicase
MKATKTIRLDGRLAGRSSLRIWATAENGEPIRADELKLLLFARDPDTFYGTFADTWEEGPLSGVALSGEDIAPFLREPPANPLLRLEWADALAPLRRLLADESVKPYRLAFSLREPQDGETWALTAYLVSRDGGPAEPLDERGRLMEPVPGNAPEAADAARELLQTWLRLVPRIRSEADPSALRTALSDAEAWLFLTEWSRELTEWGADVWLPAWWARLKRRKPKLTAKIRGTAAAPASSLFGVDRLMQFDWRISIGDAELDEAEFLALAESGKTLHRIRGEWVALDPALLSQIRRIMQEARRGKGIPLRNLLLETVSRLEGGDRPDDDEGEGIVTAYEPDESLAAWLRELARLGDTADLPVPAGFRGELRPYQKRGFAWLAGLYRFGFGGCLADDMGLGKTVQYIVYLLHLLEKEAAGPSLLICPTSLIGNWQKELSRFAPGVRVLVHYGSGRARDEADFRDRVRDCDLVLTTYKTALLDRKLLHAFNWHSLCLDEAQHLRNTHTKQAAAIRRLPAVHRVALTGTPLENRPADLWSVIDFVNPGYLGSLAGFEKRFGRTAESGRDAETLRRIVRPFLLRRMKTDPRIAPDLPEKIETNLYVPLTKQQAALYEGVLDRLWNGIAQTGGMARRGRILTAITQLKQICGHPALYMKETRDPNPDPALSNKSAVLLDMVAELRARGESSLIFTQYAAMGFLLRRMLENALNEPVLYLHGGTPKAERERLVERFKGGGVFVLSLRAGGTGLNLTAANHVFHYDRWWNPAVELQATDRAHRIGQHRTVHVHKLIALGTLEEKIDELIGKKRDLMKSITDFDERALSELDEGELRELVELRRNWVDA